MATNKIEIFIEGKDGLSRPAETASRSLSGLERASQSSGQALGGLEARAKAAGSGIEHFGQAAQRAGMLMTLASAPIIGLGVAATKMAMDAVESENLFEVSMDNMAGDARDFSEELRRQFGLNAYEVRKQVGTFNVMFSTMGMGKQAAYDMATGLTQLAYDFSSFYNLKPDEAFLKLQAGISGEIEPLRRLGINMSETTIQAFALKKGLTEQGQEMSESQKIVARYLYLLENTSKAQGDLGRTIESPTNALRVFKSRMEEITTHVGEQFLPALSSALGWLNTTALPGLETALDDTKTAWGTMSDDAQRGIITTGALLVAGGPLITALAGASKAVYALATSFQGATAKALVLVTAAAAAGAATEAAMFAGTHGVDKFGERFKSNMGNVGNQITGVTDKLAGMVVKDEAFLATSNRMYEVKKRLHDMEQDIVLATGNKTRAEQVYQQALENRSGRLQFGDISKRQEDALKSMTGWQERALALTEERKQLEQELGELEGRIGGEALMAGVSTLGQYTKGVQDSLQAMSAFQPKAKTQLDEALAVMDKFAASTKKSVDATAMWNQAQGLQADPTKAAKISKDMQDATAKAVEQMLKLDEAYIGNLIDMRAKHAKSLADISEDEEKANKRFTKQIEDRTATFNVAMAEQKTSHEKSLANIDTQEAKATQRFQKQLEERQLSYSLAMTELDVRHAKSVTDINANENKSNQQFQRQINERVKAWYIAQADIEARHAETVADIRAQERDLQTEFVRQVMQRYQRYADEARQAPDRFLRERDAAKRSAEDIQKAIAAEEEKGTEADEALLASLRGRLEEEQSAQKLTYTQYVAQLRARQTQEEAEAQASHQRQLAKLRERLADEEREYQKRLDKAKADYAEDMANYRRSQDEKRAEFSDRRTEENTEFERRKAKIKADFEHDTANYQASLNEQKAAFILRRSEENTEFEARKLKMKADFDDDVTNYATAQAEQLAEFKSKRAQEATEHNIAMLKRLKAYNDDVDEVRRAEGLKLDAFKARLAEETRLKGANSNVVPIRPGIPIVPQAQGGMGIVRHPTLFLAGEAGPEPYWFGGSGGGSGSGSASPMNVIDYNKLAAAMAHQPIVIQIDGEEIVVRGYEQARRRGRIA